MQDRSKTSLGQPTSDVSIHSRIIDGPLTKLDQGWRKTIATVEGRSSVLYPNRSASREVRFAGKLCKLLYFTSRVMLDLECSDRRGRPFPSLYVELVETWASNFSL